MMMEKRSISLNVIWIASVLLLILAVVSAFHLETELLPTDRGVQGVRQCDNKTTRHETTSLTAAYATGCDKVPCLISRHQLFTIGFEVTFMETFSDLDMFVTVTFGTFKVIIRSKKLCEIAVPPECPKTFKKGESYNFSQNFDLTHYGFVVRLPTAFLSVTTKDPHTKAMSCNGLEAKFY